MSPEFKLEKENIGITVAFIFYVIVGIVCFIFLPISNYPPHIGIIGVFSLLSAYGLFKKRVWAIWLIAMLFFVATTFSAAMLYYNLGRDMLLNVSMIAYLVLTWVFTAYVAAKREILET